MLEYPINDTFTLKLKDSWKELSQVQFIQVCELIDQCLLGSYGFDELRVRMVPCLLVDMPFGKINLISDNILAISKHINFFFNDSIPNVKRKIRIELDYIIIKELPAGYKSYSFINNNGRLITSLTVGQFLFVQHCINRYYDNDYSYLDHACITLLNCAGIRIKFLSPDVKRAVLMNFIGICNFISYKTKYRLLFHGVEYKGMCDYDEQIDNRLVYEQNLIDFMDSKVLSMLN